MVLFLKDILIILYKDYHNYKQRQLVDRETIGTNMEIKGMYKIITSIYRISLRAEIDWLI